MSTNFRASLCVKQTFTPKPMAHHALLPSAAGRSQSSTQQGNAPAGAPGDAPDSAEKWLLRGMSSGGSTAYLADRTADNAEFFTPTTGREAFFSPVSAASAQLSTPVQVPEHDVCALLNEESIATLGEVCECTTISLV